MLRTKIRQWIDRQIDKRLDERLEQGIKIGKNTVYAGGDRVHISDSKPSLQLEGTETNGENLSIRENAGNIELYDEASGAVAGSWDLNPALSAADIDEIVSSISELREDTSANKPTAGTEGRIFFESDTGKVLYDDGSSWVDLGLSEDQISLANLSSNSHSDLADAPTAAHHTMSSVTGFTADTAANRPAAGTSGAIFYETDTGRVLRDDGSSWVEMGLSESQISLANLSSRAHSDLSDAPAGAHHSESESDTDTQSGDGTTTTFTISHSLGSTPASATVVAASADANGDFHVSSKSSSSVDITYASAPSSGTDNLSWEVITHA